MSLKMTVSKDSQADVLCCPQRHTHVPNMPLSSYAELSPHPVSSLTFRNSSSVFLQNLLRRLTLGSLLNAMKQFVHSITHQKFRELDYVLFTFKSPFLSNSYSTTVTQCDIPPWNFTEIPIPTVLLTCSSKNSYLVSCSQTDYPNTHTQACAGMFKSDCIFRERMATW